MPKFRWDQYLSLCLVLLGLLFSQGGMAVDNTSLNSNLVLPQLVSVAPIPIFVDEASNGPEVTTLTLEDAQAVFTATLSAKAIYVMDVPSAAVLLQKNSDQRYAPASTTKLLTALLTREIFGLDQELEVTSEASSSGTRVGLVAGEQLPVRDLLSAMLIQSGNDAAMVVANHHPAGYPGFISAMNAKAQQIGLSHSRFTNPSGIDEIEHQMTARDLAILAREVMKDQLLAEIVGTESEIIQSQTQSLSHQLFNTNALLTANLGIIGIKTGTTESAGEVLVTESKAADHDLIIVVMGSTDRYEDTKQILSWVLSHYIWVDPNSDTLPIIE